MVHRRHICDVPGCGNTRQRWQRLCGSCFAALPHNIRTGLIDAYKQGRKKDWRAWCRAAGAEINPAASPAPAPPRARHISAQRAQELQQRMLGERPDA